MRELQDKINSVEPEVFNFCSELLAQVLFTPNQVAHVHDRLVIMNRVYTFHLFALLSLMLGKKIGIQEKLAYLGFKCFAA